MEYVNTWTLTLINIFRMIQMEEMWSWLRFTLPIQSNSKSQKKFFGSEKFLLMWLNQLGPIFLGKPPVLTPCQLAMTQAPSGCYRKCWVRQFIYSASSSVIITPKETILVLTAQLCRIFFFSHNFFFSCDRHMLALTSLLKVQQPKGQWCLKQLAPLIKFFSKGSFLVWCIFASKSSP